MTHTAFGTLMAVEPAIGVLLGMIVLHQIPSSWQGVGIFLVIVAGAAAQRFAARAPAPDAPAPDIHAPDIHAPDIHAPDGPVDRTASATEKP
jgi:inner membrane transporter RhtA